MIHLLALLDLGTPGTSAEPTALSVSPPKKTASLQMSALVGTPGTLGTFEEDQCGPATWVNLWRPEDWQVFFDERAAIFQFDGGLSRIEAEARAYACCVTVWMNCNAVRSLPGHCVSCGGAEHTAEPLLPFGTDATGHAWLHSTCWRDWNEGRKTEAAAALTSMAITRSRVDQ